MPMTRAEAVSAHNDIGKGIQDLLTIMNDLSEVNARLAASGHANGELENAVMYIDSQIGELREMERALPEPDELPDMLSRRPLDMDFGEFARDTLNAMNRWHAEAAE